jgi:hypothetical protein
MDRYGFRRNIGEETSVIGSVYFQSGQRPINLPTFLEFPSELAGKKERNYVKFRAGATPPKQSGGGAFLVQGDGDINPSHFVQAHLRNERGGRSGASGR